MKKMKISVIMAIYNGEKYLLEQMQSLVNQTRKIDEVLILDDCSTDTSVKIVEDYINKNNLSNWTIVQSKENNGWKKNFYRGFEMATGDIIFPCDQDDIWHADKIEVMAAELEKNPDVYVLAGKPYKFFDENTENKKHNTLRVQVGIWLDQVNERKNLCQNTKKTHLLKFDESFLKRAPGCVLAIRKDFFDTIREYWCGDIAHDAILAYFSKITAHYYTLDYEVIDWRQHVGSASRPSERNKKRRCEELKLDLEMLRLIDVFANCNDVSKEYFRILNRAKQWNKLRKCLVENNDITSAIKLLAYHKYYLQFRRYFTDLKYGLEK